MGFNCTPMKVNKEYFTQYQLLKSLTSQALLVILCTCENKQLNS
jgi:hypothetical protein